MSHVDKLRLLDACDAAIMFAERYPNGQAAWDACESPSWMRWLLLSCIGNKAVLRVIPQLIRWRKRRRLSVTKLTRALNRGHGHYALMVGTERLDFKLVCRQIRRMFPKVPRIPRTLANEVSCDEAQEFAMQFDTAQDAWNACRQSSWMGWLFCQLDIEPRLKPVLDELVEEFEAYFRSSPADPQLDYWKACFHNVLASVIVGAYVEALCWSLNTIPNTQCNHLCDRIRKHVPEVPTMEDLTNDS
jgi:hypothetical protein